jgi:hypothetical protein
MRVFYKEPLRVVGLLDLFVVSLVCHDKFAILFCASPRTKYGA